MKKIFVFFILGIFSPLVWAGEIEKELVLSQKATVQAQIRLINSELNLVRVQLRIKNKEKKGIEEEISKLEEEIEKISSEKEISSSKQVVKKIRNKLTDLQGSYEEVTEELRGLKTREEKYQNQLAQLQGQLDGMRFREQWESWDSKWGLAIGGFSSNTTETSWETNWIIDLRMKVKNLTIYGEVDSVGKTGTTYWLVGANWVVGAFPPLGIKFPIGVEVESLLQYSTLVLRFRPILALRIENKTYFAEAKWGVGINSPHTISYLAGFYF